MALQTQGGTIKTLKAIGHETYKGVADWFFIADVEYEDGGENIDLHISPAALYCDHDNKADKAELDSALKRLNDYLQAAGDWHDMKHKRDGRCYSWTPKAPKGQEPL